MRHSILDHVARLLILGALSVGTAKALPAQTIIKDIPADIYSNAVQKGDTWWLNAPGSYLAVQTETVGGGFGEKLGIGRNVELSVRGANAVSGLYVIPDVHLDGGTLKGTGEKTAFGLEMENGDFIQTNGKLEVTGQDRGVGLFLHNGSFLGNGGTIKAHGDGYVDDDHRSAGILLTGKNGTFTMNNGTLTATGKNGGNGINIAEGDFVMDGGSLSAFAEGGVGEPDHIYARGIVTLQGDYHFNNARVTTRAGNYARGISSNGDLFMTGGSLDATATGSIDSNGILTENMTFSDVEIMASSENATEAIFANNRFTAIDCSQDYSSQGKDGEGYSSNALYAGGGIDVVGGTMHVVGNADGIAVVSFGDFTSDRGNLTFRGYDSGSGIWTIYGDFIVRNETDLFAYAEGYDAAPLPGEEACSTGIRVLDGNFRMEESRVVATGVNGGDGISVSDGDFIVDGGRLSLLGEGKTFEPDPNGVQIKVVNNAIQITGGGTDYFGCGGVVKGGDFIVNDGFVSAVGMDGGCGLFIDGGDFILNGGAFELVHWDDAPLAGAVVGGNAKIGADALFLTVLNPMLGSCGTMLVSGNVEIESGAEFDLGLGGTVGLKKGAENAVTATFMAIDKPYDDIGGPAQRGTISGEFVPIGTETMTFSYGIAKSADQKRYELTAVRNAYASEFLDGNNARLARVLERRLPDLDFLDNETIHDTYLYMDLAQTSEEMNATARSLTPWQATQYAIIGLGLVDSTQLDMSRNLDLVRQFKASCDPCDPCGTPDGCGSNKDPRHLWFAGHGHFGHFGAKSGSFAALDVDSYGMNVGMARRLAGFGRNTVAGISFNYTNGNIGGEGVHADYDYYGFLASVRTDLQRIRGWGELSFGYSHGDFDQRRFDFLENGHFASVDNDLVRLGVTVGRDFSRGKGRRITPIAALEYTRVHQGGYTERGNFQAYDLAVGGDNLNSLRLRFGAETQWSRKRLNLTAFGFVRYEMLDRNMVLDTRFNETPVIRFDTRGQDYNRCSGMLGTKLDWQLSKRSHLGAGYDFTVGDKYTEHWVDLVYRRTW